MSRSYPVAVDVSTAVAELEMCAEILRKLQTVMIARNPDLIAQYLNTVGRVVDMAETLLVTVRELEALAGRVELAAE